jgi:type II secretory pathway pseudopilin PulG
MRKTKKRNVTLIEMMIVMFLIALISGVVAYNYRGTLDEGKAFKTAADIKTIENILNLASANEDVSTVLDDWPKYIEKSPLVQNPKAMLKDGWGGAYHAFLGEEGNIVVTSKKFDDYRISNPGTMFKK